MAESTAGERKPVMSDVARLAGVSHQTVSRVLNDSPNVKEGTRDRVLQAIRELDYRPNSAARALVTKRSQTLGVVSFDTTLYGPASMLHGIEHAARGHDYFVSIVSVRTLDSRSVQDAVERLRGQAVEGVLVIAPQLSAASALARLGGELPLVAVGSGPKAKVPAVAVDNEAGARAVTRHLLDLGHRTVHHVAGPPNWLESEARVAGWRAVLAESGAPEPEVLTGDWSARSGYELGLRLAADPEVTAVFCANDPMALGLLRALNEAGISVPGDISVAGFDDIPEAEFFTPPLTTVRQDFGELGRRGLELLVDRIEAGAGAGRRPHVLVPPLLLPRASTAAPGR